VLKAPSMVPDGIYALAAIVWLILVLGYLAQGWRQIVADLRDPVEGPFVPVAAITGTILGATLAASTSPASALWLAGRVLVVGFFAVTISIGGWLIGQWLSGGLKKDCLHPGYLLPTVAGGLVGATAAADVRLRALAEASFGIGIGCWLLLGSAVWARLLLRPPLAPPLLPTLAIELAPPAVAGIAWFALNGGEIDFTARALGGLYAIMLLAQVRFLPLYTRLRFTPGFWAFAFAYAAAATYALTWITLAMPRGATAYTVAILTLITVFIAALGSRTAVAAIRGQLLVEKRP
jgi:tellurite resistance protein